MRLKTFLKGAATAAILPSSLDASELISKATFILFSVLSLFSPHPGRGLGGRGNKGGRGD